MPISSVIVRKAASVEPETFGAEISAIDGATLEHREGANFVVIIEAPTKGAEKDIWNSLEAIEGATNVDLIYHNFEDIQA